MKMMIDIVAYLLIIPFCTVGLMALFRWDLAGFADGWRWAGAYAGTAIYHVVRRIQIEGRLRTAQRLLIVKFNDELKLKAPGARVTSVEVKD
jgi:hypothetical protein